MSGPTRAELAAQVETLRAERDEWKAAKIPDAEAEAISACVKALTKLAPDTRPALTRPAGDVGRVLRYLADRYNIQWGDSEHDRG